MKEFLRKTVIPYLLQLFVRFIYLTNKKRYFYAKVDEKRPLIIAMWHGDLLMQPLNYRHFRKNGKVKVIVSEHRDGELIKKIVQYLGVGGIDGSSSKGGLKALMNAIKEIKQGNDVAITPDGPRGPRFSVANGIVAIAQKTDCQIVALNAQPSKYWQFKSWDKFVVPKPFGRIDFYVGEPFSITGLEMDDAKALIREKLHQNNVMK
ncbi:lysophospholipid acyltransferase family protein [Candidatus Marinarcus aquaticus]|uniref:DUF374 domain-containing protein n=1 Tax=Candidatus Marinarcus aquaticus TaxID=2044504 RepID=A0A4Q0XQT0_9BACT|nr:lysophospholipid acyltransferase family protein [Candidatus Marinarcus aquaticus]RXJ56419.1 hypothetical protein CRV04_08360 [Candidatus Marinarcus aquaticus]